MKKFRQSYKEIITLESLLLAWQEFLRGKSQRHDVASFAARLVDNILGLRDELLTLDYKHGPYQAFNISDPKPRHIHKASVRDRLVHHLIYRTLYPYFEEKFIFDSYSCRIAKGTHLAIRRFQEMSRTVSRNNTLTVWVLKCDIKKFFANIDHIILKSILVKYIVDNDLLFLLGLVIGSFHAGQLDKGLPLGNLTSQLLVNIYMNEFDYFIKETLKTEYCIRYADDFVIMSEDKNWLESLIPKIEDFLWKSLRLQLHPNKVFIKTLASGVDFLGWVNFPTHRVLRTATKRRMFKKIKSDLKAGTVSSYLGMLQHGDAHELKKEILEIVKNR